MTWLLTIGTRRVATSLPNPRPLAPLPTANGQGTVILSVCKNHPKCWAQGKTKRVNGTVPPVDGTRCNDGNLTPETIGNSQIDRDGTLQLSDWQTIVQPMAGGQTATPLPLPGSYTATQRAINAINAAKICKKHMCPEKKNLLLGGYRFTSLCN